MWSKNSTTVTFEPNLFQTLESSRPIYPPPITINSFGTFSNDKAPVDETIVCSSIFNPGRDVGVEPVAIRMFFAL